MKNIKLRNPLYNLIPLLVIIFFDSFAYFLIIPVLLQIFISTHIILPANISLEIRNLLFGIALMISPLAFLLASPLVGHLSDRFGRKKIMLLCLLMTFLGFILPIMGIIKKQIALIFLGRFIAGGSTSSQPIAQAAMADVSKGYKKAYYLSLIGFAMTLAMILGPIIGSLFSQKSFGLNFNLTAPYWIGVSISLLNIVLLLFFFKDTLTTSDQKKDHSLRQLINILNINKVYILLLVFFLLEFAWSQYYQSIFLFLNQKFHYSTSQIGVFTAYIGLWMSLGLTIFYRILLKMITVERIAKLSLIITSISFLLCTITIYPIYQWLFIIPASIFTGMAYASLLAMISNRTASTHQGLILGWASTTLATAWMITGFLSGLLINIFKDLPIYLTAIVMVLGLIIFLFNKGNT